MFTEKPVILDPVFERAFYDFYFKIGFYYGKQHSAPSENSQKTILENENRKDAFLDGYIEGELNRMASNPEEK